MIGHNLRGRKNTCINNTENIYNFQINNSYISKISSFVTYKTPVDYSYFAPDGSLIWKLPDVSGAGLAKCILPAWQVSKAKRHKTVNEIWYFISGQGQLWRKNDNMEEETYLSSELSITIPVGTHFQFRNLSGQDLVILILTSPVWPGPDEAIEVPDHWPSSKVENHHLKDCP